QYLTAKTCISVEDVRLAVDRSFWLSRATGRVENKCRLIIRRFWKLDWARRRNLRLQILPRLARLLLSTTQNFNNTDNAAEAPHVFKPMCQQRTAETDFNQGKPCPGVVKDCTLIFESEGHVDGNGYCSHRAYGNECFNKLGRIMEQQGHAIAWSDAKTL